MIKKSPLITKYTVMKIKDAESFDINNPKSVCGLRIFDTIEAAQAKCDAKNKSSTDLYNVYILRFRLEIFSTYHKESITWTT